MSDISVVPENPDALPLVGLPYTLLCRNTNTLLPPSGQMKWLLNGETLTPGVNKEVSAVLQPVEYSGDIDNEDLNSKYITEDVTMEPDLDVWALSSDTTQSGHLVFEELQPRDTGQYTCVSINENNMASYASYSLTVWCKYMHL